MTDPFDHYVFGKNTGGYDTNEEALNFSPYSDDSDDDKPMTLEEYKVYNKIKASFLNGKEIYIYCDLLKDSDNNLNISAEPPGQSRWCFLTEGGRLSSALPFGVVL